MVVAGNGHPWRRISSWCYRTRSPPTRCQEPPAASSILIRCRIGVGTVMPLPPENRTDRHQLGKPTEAVTGRRLPRSRTAIWTDSSRQSGLHPRDNLAYFTLNRHNGRRWGMTIGGSCKLTFLHTRPSHRIEAGPNVIPRSIISLVPWHGRIGHCCMRCHGRSKGQHSTTLTARPPCEVSLYLLIMSSPVCFMVRMA